jgi:hypothetical protein
MRDYRAASLTPAASYLRPLAGLDASTAYALYFVIFESATRHAEAHMSRLAAPQRHVTATRHALGRSSNQAARPTTSQKEKMQMWIKTITAIGLLATLGASPALAIELVGHSGEMP